MLRQTPRTSRRPASLLLAAAALVPILVAAAVIPRTWALDHNWINPAGGFSWDAANWNNGTGPSVPGPNDNARFNVVGTYTVNWAFPIDSVATLASNAGRFRFNINGRLGLQGGAALHPDSLTILSGTLGLGYLNLSYAASGTNFRVGNANTSVQMRDSTEASYWCRSNYQLTVRIDGGSNMRCNGYIIMAADSAGRCSTTVTGKFFSGAVSRLSTLSSLDPSFGNRGDIYVGDRGNAVLRVINGAEVEVAGDLFIASGTSSTSKFDQLNLGSVFTSTSIVHGNTYVGSNARSSPPLGAGNGTLLHERGSLTLLGPCRVGGRGAGQMTVRNQSLLTATDIWVAPDSSGLAAQFAIHNALANVTNSFAVGGTSTTRSGHNNCSAIVDSGGILNYSGPTPIRIWARPGYTGGYFGIWTGGQVTSTVSDVRLGGTLELAATTLTAPRVQLTGSGNIIGAGMVRARILSTDTASIEAFTPGPASNLIVGDSTASDGYVGLATIATSDDTVEIRDSDGFDVGNILLGHGGNDGTLLVRSGARLVSGKYITGYGTVVGNLVNEGALAPVINTLNFTGHLTHLTGTVDPGSSSIHILGTGALTARGTMDLASMSMDGHMDMGPSPAKLALLGTLAMSPTSSSRFKIGKKSSGIKDTLAVTGAAQFDGVLDLRSIPGNDPVAGDTIPIATMGSMTHAFSSVTINGVPAAGWLTVLYEPTVVKVVVLKQLVGIETGNGASAAVEPRFMPAGNLARPGFALHLPSATHARVAAYDVTGREIAVLADALLPAGLHEFALPREGIANGVCFGRAVLTGSGGAGQRILTARVVRVR